jgi:hypothetical protein
VHTDRADRVFDPESPERRNAGWNQRLADDELGPALVVEERDIVSVQRQERREGRARRAGADDRNPQPTRISHR